MAPGFGEISPGILQELNMKVIVHPTRIYNAVSRTEVVPEQRKRAEVIVLLKPPESFLLLSTDIASTTRVKTI